MVSLILARKLIINSIYSDNYKVLSLLFYIVITFDIVIIRYLKHVVEILCYLNKYGTVSLGGTESPNKEASWAILSNTLLTISPKYMPEISFSNI